jgi:eukaryotic-like serine/threonine-protein kinase
MHTSSRNPEALVQSRAIILADFMTLATGTKLGPYEILAPLGAGGMGEVYRACDTRLQRTVAIKILPLQFSSDPVRKERFEREAKTISNLNHPHICVLYDVGHQQGIDYLVMECVEGETLAKRLEKGPLPLDQVAKYGAQIADALDIAHHNGVVHRDLKPGNIMLTTTGAKLLDFGLAKPATPLPGDVTLTGAQTSPLTEQNTIIGTFQYMSPEQVEGKHIDWRSDIFSLGAVLYEMVTGKRAFEGKSQFSVASAILEKEPAPICAIKPMAPLALDHVIRRCLAKSPGDRWQSAADLKCELEWIAETGARSGVLPVPAIRGGRALILYAGLVTILAFALAGLLWYQSSKPRPASPPVRFTLTLPASEALAVTNGSALAFAPDARRLVYVVRHSETTQLFVRDIAAFEGKLLAGTDGATGPFFSPDGEWIGFYADGKLKKVSVDGGPAINLCEAPEGNGATWLPDNTIVFNADWREGLRRVSAAGGTPAALTRPDLTRGETFHWWPDVLPGGQAVLFTDQRGPGSEGAGIAVLSLKNGKWETVIEKGTNPHYLRTGHILYLNGSALFAAPFDAEDLKVTGPPSPVLQGVLVDPDFSTAQAAVSREGSIAYVPGTVTRMQNMLMKVDRKGHEQPLTDIHRGFEDLTISPDGRFLATTIMGDVWNVWLYDLGRGALSRLTFEGDNRDPIWTADSKRVIYVSFRNGHFGIFWKPVSGGGSEEELVATESLPWPTSCSRDGRWFTYDVGPPAPATGIYLLPLIGERKPAPIIVEPFAEAAMISPDGKWIAYESRESGRSEIYVRQFPSGATKWQITTEGGIRPKWSASGSELFFRTGGIRSESTLMSVAIQTEPSLITSKPRPLFQFRYAQAGHDYAVMPDNQHFICIKESEHETSATQVNVILNWNAELKEK